METQVYAYGDSLLKATMPDENFRYHFHINEIIDKYVPEGFKIINRAKMGATIRKGKALVEHDLERGMDAKYALVDFGGNDCDFNWEEVAANPEGEHHCHTEMPEFLQTLKETTTALSERGIQPVLMTLPPIDGQRYLDFFCRNGVDKDKILQWLGDAQMIYRYQEWYSDAVAKFATEEKLPLIPVREAFLQDRDFSNMIASDGIHLTMPGYDRLYSTISGWMQTHLGVEN